MIIASRSGREGARPHAARAHPRHGVGRRRAARHGHRPGAGDAEAAGAPRPEDRATSMSIELNEAFAAQALAVLRELGLPDDADHVNPNGGAIALGHPLGMSGARLALTAVHQLEKTGGKRAPGDALRRRRPGPLGRDRAGAVRRLRLAILLPSSGEWRSDASRMRALLPSPRPLPVGRRWSSNAESGR